MSPDLESCLYRDFPKLFVQKDLPKEQTCMCWGIETPDEWYPILYTLCECIQEYIDTKENTKQIEFTQVKEKFGFLRIYTNYQDSFVNGVIAMADKTIELNEKNSILDRLDATPSIGAKTVEELRKKIKGKRL